MPRMKAQLKYGFSTCAHVFFFCCFYAFGYFPSVFFSSVFLLFLQCLTTESLSCVCLTCFRSSFSIGLHLTLHFFLSPFFLSFGFFSLFLMNSKHISHIVCVRLCWWWSFLQVVRMFIAVVTIFAICWLPYHMFYVYAYHQPHITSTSSTPHLFLAFYWLAMSNSMVNPIIYYWMNRRFRHYFQRILCFCCFRLWKMDETFVQQNSMSIERKPRLCKYFILFFFSAMGLLLSQPRGTDRMCQKKMSQNHTVHENQ